MRYFWQKTRGDIPYPFPIFPDVIHKAIHLKRHSGISQRLSRYTLRTRIRIYITKLLKSPVKHSWRRYRCSSMPKLPQISGGAFCKALMKDGWFAVNTEGSHRKMRKLLQPVGRKTVIVPLHKTLKKGTLSGILKDCGISVEKLLTLL